MVIVLYLIDNSASMNQRSYLGITYLDIAKNAVDAFAKVRHVYSMFKCIPVLVSCTFDLVSPSPTSFEGETHQAEVIDTCLSRMEIVRKP